MWLRGHNNEEIVYITLIPDELNKPMNLKEFVDELYLVDHKDAKRSDKVTSAARH